MDVDMADVSAVQLPPIDIPEEPIEEPQDVEAKLAALDVIMNDSGVFSETPSDGDNEHDTMRESESRVDDHDTQAPQPVDVTPVGATPVDSEDLRLPPNHGSSSDSADRWIAADIKDDKIAVSDTLCNELPEAKVYDVNVFVAHNNINFQGSCSVSPLLRCEDDLDVNLIKNTIAEASPGVECSISCRDSGLLFLEAKLSGETKLLTMQIVQPRSSRVSESCDIWSSLYHLYEESNNKLSDYKFNLHLQDVFPLASRGKGYWGASVRVTIPHWRFDDGHHLKCRAHTKDAIIGILARFSKEGQGLPITRLDQVNTLASLYETIEPLVSQRVRRDPIVMATRGLTVTARKVLKLMKPLENTGRRQRTVQFNDVAMAEGDVAMAEGDAAMAEGGVTMAEGADQPAVPQAESHARALISLPRKRMAIFWANHHTAEMLRLIMKCLDSKSLRALRCTCRMVQELGCDIIPGLRLNLLAHQVPSVFFSMVSHFLW